MIEQRLWVGVVSYDSTGEANVFVDWNRDLVEQHVFETIVEYIGCSVDDYNSLEDMIEFESGAYRFSVTIQQAENNLTV